MNAFNSAVIVNDKKFKELKQLCPVDLNHEDTILSNVLIAIIAYLPMGNHIITHISHNGIKYDFDPTNDIFLTEKNGKLYSSDSQKYYIKHDRIKALIPVLLGQNDVKITSILKIQDKELPTISHEEYMKIYRETLEMIKDNLDIFEHFYNENEDKYNEIANIANEQHSLIKRVMPVK